MSAFTDAAEARLASAPASVLRVYKTGEVPPSPVLPYAVLAVLGDRATAYTNDATHSVRFHRIVAQSFGKTFDAADDIDSRVVDAFLDHRLVVAGYDCGPCELEVGSALQDDPDDNGVVGITTTLTFAATKE